MVKILAVCVVIGLMGCATPSQQVAGGAPPTLPVGAQTMSTDQMKAAFSGKTMEGTVASGKYAGVTWRQVQQPDGSETLVTSDGLNDQGHVDYRNGSSCDTWQKLHKGQETCSLTLKYGDNAYASYSPGGEIGSTFRVVP